MYVCLAMRFVMLCGIQLKVDMGEGDRPTRFVGIFSKRPHPGSKVIQAGVKILFFLRGLLLEEKSPRQSIYGGYLGVYARGALNFIFGECVPCGFQNVGSREQIFLKKWGSWERKWSCVAWWDVFALQTPKLMICPPFLLKTNIS